MTLSLTPEQEELVNEQISSGKYQSANEVITEALRLLKERNEIYKGRFEELKKEIMLGIEAADRGEVVDGATVLHELREKNRQRREEKLTQ